MTPGESLYDIMSQLSEIEKEIIDVKSGINTFRDDAGVVIELESARIYVVQAAWFLNEAIGRTVHGRAKNG